MRVEDCWYVELGESTVTMELEKKKKKVQAYFYSLGLIYSTQFSDCLPFIEIIFFIRFSADYAVQYKAFANIFLSSEWSRNVWSGTFT